jgi:hypothetical protein
MSRAISTTLGKEVADALGLKNVIEFDIHFPLSGAVTAEVKFYPDAEDGKRLPAIMKRYILTELK